MLSPNLNIIGWRPSAVPAVKENCSALLKHTHRCSPKKEQKEYIGVSSPPQLYQSELDIWDV